MAIQLDNHRIAVRERGFLEILDLALLVIRAQGAGLLAAFAVGVLPAIVLNCLLIGHLVEPEFGDDWTIDENYAMMMALLVGLEMPFVTAPATLYLGHSMFQDTPQPRQVAADFWHSLPQLFLLQGLGRALCFSFFCLAFIPPLLPFIYWPYLSEVILLEKNPLFAGRQKRLTTYRRTSVLHAGSVGDLIGRWLGCVMFGSLLTVGIWLSLQMGLGLLIGWRSWETSLLWFLPIAIWVVICYFTVVRFLFYLDTRIRREGWEVELAMKAEALKLARHVA